jgi:hypothetical protein
LSSEFNKPVFFGLMGVGFLAMLGGIAMFVYVVPRDMDTGGIPRDVGLLFTNVFSQQILLKNERNRYAAALTEVGVDRETCDRFQCRLTVQPDGKDYIFRLSKEGHTWAIVSKSPVPKEVP